MIIRILICNCRVLGKDLMDILTTSPQLCNIKHVFLDVPSLVSIPLKHLQLTSSTCIGIYSPTIAFISILHPQGDEGNLRGMETSEGTSIKICSMLRSWGLVVGISMRSLPCPMQQTRNIWNRQGKPSSIWLECLKMAYKEILSLSLNSKKILPLGHTHRIPGKVLKKAHAPWR